MCDYVPLLAALTSVHYSQWFDHVPFTRALTAVYYSQWIDYDPLNLAAVHYSQLVDNFTFIVISLFYVILLCLIMFRFSCFGCCILFQLGLFYSPCSCFDCCTLLTMIDHVPLSHDFTDVHYS